MMFAVVVARSVISTLSLSLLSGERLVCINRKQTIKRTQPVTITRTHPVMTALSFILSSYPDHQGSGSLIHDRSVKFL